MTHELRRALRGVVYEPPPEQYQTDFGKVELRRPQLVIKARTIDDVQHAVHYAKQRGMRVTIRGHGCSSAGLCVSDEVVLDMTGLQGICIRSDRLATVDAGVRWTPLQEQLVERGLSSVVFGDSPAATIGGLLSVGGFGSTSAWRGPAINYVKALEIVTGHGELVRAEPEGEHAELFRYALGGLGQVGVIVRADIELRSYKPYLVMQAQTFDGSTSVEAINTFLKDALPWAHSFVAYDIGVRQWRALWATEHDERPTTRGAPAMASMMFGLSHLISPLMGFPAVAPDLAPPGAIGRLLRRAMGDGERRDKMQRSLEHAVESAPNGIAIKHAHRFFNQGAEAFVQALIDANIAKGRVTRGDTLRNIWNDYLVPTENAQAFFDAARPVIDDPVTTRGFWGTIFFNDDKAFSRLPLSPVPPAERVNSFGPYCMVPPAMVADYRERFDRMREACLEAGGRVYLFGYHPKSESFYRRQFGDTAVDGWKAAKNRYDPGNVLGAAIF
jgi:FAD/FMN-containing dehydrogenase